MLLNIKPQDYILDFTAFNSGDILAIGKKLDWVARDIMTFADWCDNYKGYTNIRVAGLEQDAKLIRKLEARFRKRVRDCHLFVAQQTGQSFGWHTDDKSVILYVVKGFKEVYTPKGITLLRRGQYIHLPKGMPHKVINKANTVALSIGV